MRFSPLSLLSLLLASPAFANNVEIQPSQDLISPALVEQVITLAPESSEKAGVRLVKIDNGGSSDIGSMMAPSRLYLTLHQDGEMYDIVGNYLILQGVLLVKAATLKNGLLTLIYVARNADMKLETTYLKLSIQDALTEAGNAQKSGNDEEFTDYVLKSSLLTLPTR